MLKFLRGRKRSRNAVLILFIAVLTISLVALFSASGSGAKLLGTSAGSDSVIAKVGSYEITFREYKEALANFGQQIAQGRGKNQQDDLRTLFEQFGPQVLDNLIRQKLKLYQADRLNLGATDNEVTSRLHQIFNPWPGPEGYRLRLQQAQITPVRFEDELRAAIAEEHLRSFITAGLEVDPKAVEEDYRRTNTNYTIRWVQIDPQTLRDKVVANEPDLRAYFDAHKSDFRINTEQRSARYIFVNQNKAGEAIQISDDELKQDFSPDRFIKQVRVSQIVLNAPKKVTEEDDAKVKAAKEAAEKEEGQIRNKAKDIVQRAKGTEGKAPEDFAKLAREFSQDSKTRSKGGDLGWINKNDKREADDPLNSVFSMQKDEVSEPIKKGDQYYILKVTDRKIPTFADARPELLAIARARKGYSKAVEIATDAEQKFKESKSAQDVVNEINKNYGAQVAAVKETGFFSEGDKLPEISSASQFESAVFELSNPGDIADRMNIDKGFAIPQYAEKRDPHDAAFEEVKSKVEDAYRVDKAKELAAQRAGELAKASSPDELKRMSDKMGLKVDERSSSAADSIGPLVSEATRAPVYKLNPGQVTKEPIKTESDQFVVAALVSRKDADMGEPFQKERKSIEQRLLDEKRNTFFTTYLEMTQKELREQGKIKIYEDSIASAVESSTPATQEKGQSQGGGPPRVPSSGRAPRRTPSGAQGFPGRR